MAPVRTVAAGYRHEAIYWRSEDEIPAETVPFVRDGVLAGQPVMVGVAEPRLTLLRSELGSLGDGVRFVDSGALGRDPARTLAAWRGFVEEFGSEGGQLRGVGEPCGPGGPAEQGAECQLHDRLVDITRAAGCALWLRCLHHAAAPMDLPADQGAVFVRRFTSGNLRLVRDDVFQLAREAGVSAERGADLALAMHEVATNSVLHALGWGVLRVWREPGSLVCEVRDLGRISDPTIGGREPSAHSQNGRGLWIVRQLCDRLQIQSHAGGTTVSVHTWL